MNARAGAAPPNPRKTAASMINAVVREGASLNRLLPRLADSELPARDHALVRAMVSGTLRDWPRLLWLSRQLLSKPLRQGSEPLLGVIALGLYQLSCMRVPEHAAVGETVQVARGLGGKGAAGLVNAVLRRYQREQAQWDEKAQANEVARYAHPQWWLETLRRDWPDDWKQVAQASNERAPMWLRVNLARITREDYAAKLAEALPEALGPLEDAFSPHAPAAIRLVEAVDVTALPGFKEGLVSVQDAAAQLAAGLLALQPGQRLLDACSAPGGKTAHALESCPQAQATALDIDPARLEQVDETLARVGLEADVRSADAAQLQSWWKGELYDAVLIDAPCTGSGVVRRHPDIKLLRRPQDIVSLAERQAALLQALWQVVAPGGRLVYATCSVFARENQLQIDQFVEATPEAEVQRIEAPGGWGRRAGHGRQLLPGEDGMDGFYYACMTKRKGGSV